MLPKIPNIPQHLKYSDWAWKTHFSFHTYMTYREKTECSQNLQCVLEIGDAIELYGEHADKSEITQDVE